MSSTVETDARRKMRSALAQLTARVRNSKLTEFSREDLENTFNISVGFMVLDEASPLKPSYFAPDQSSIPDPSPDSSYNGEDGEIEGSLTRPMDRANAMYICLSSYISVCKESLKNLETPWISKNVGDTLFRGLFSYDKPEYGCYRITYVDNSDYPHIMGVMYNNSVATDDTVLLGELLPILRIMLTQLRKKEFFHHMISPVLILSLMGLKARVIEASLQKEKVLLRPTKLYDFSHGNDEALKTFVRWYIGRPTGNTVSAT